MLSGLLLGLARRALRAWQAAALVAIALGLYAWLVGGSASVVRATLMAVIGLSAERLGRRTDGVRALAIASLLMAAWDPGVVWDVGYQLSAGATLGLILYTDALQKRGVALLARVMPEAWAERVAEVGGEGVFGSLSAQITTLPLILFYFQNLSLAALPANALILPPQPQVMVLGGIALLASTIWLPLGQALAWVTWPFTAYTIGLTDLFSRLPLASLSIDVPGVPALVGYYVVLATITWIARQPAEARPAWLPKDLGTPLTWTALTAAAAVALWGWAAFWRSPEPGVARLTVLALGTGSASLIETPDGGRLLLDVGPPGLASSRAPDAQLPRSTGGSPGCCSTGSPTSDSALCLISRAAIASTPSGLRRRCRPKTHGWPRGPCSPHPGRRSRPTPNASNSQMVRPSNIWVLACGSTGERRVCSGSRRRNQAGFTSPRL